MINITDSAVIKHLLAKNGLEPSRSLGQNFLICEEVVKATLLSMDSASKNVTELGHGMGALTQALAASKFNVKAIEQDSNMVKIIKQILTPKQRLQVNLVHADLKDIDWTWEKDYQLAGNIPYNLSGLIIRRITKLDPMPEQAILLVQKEVGVRLTTKAPDMSLISLAVSLWGSAEKIMNVPRNCFLPAPKVDSALMLLKPRENNRMPLLAREKVMVTAKHFFQKKRKQIGGTMRRSFQLSDQEIAAICKQAGINPVMRPQEISTEAWQKITDLLK